MWHRLHVVADHIPKKTSSVVWILAGSPEWCNVSHRIKSSNTRALRHQLHHLLLYLVHYTARCDLHAHWHCWVSLLTFACIREWREVGWYRCIRHLQFHSSCLRSLTSKVTESYAPHVPHAAFSLSELVGSVKRHSVQARDWIQQMMISRIVGMSLVHR